MREEVKWTNLTKIEIADRLSKTRAPVSVNIVTQLLNDINFRRRKLRKTLPMGRAPRRNDQFTETEATMPNGEVVTMKLAERGSLIGSRSDGMWIREVRKLTSSGHQTSLISTAYGQLGLKMRRRLFSRWCQENFFRYMMEHFAIDALSEYRTEEIPETNRPVVNPAWRELDRQSRSVKGKLTQRQARFAALTLTRRPKKRKSPNGNKQKSDLREEIEQLEHELTA